jgi:hypothetical protein
MKRFNGLRFGAKVLAIAFGASGAWIAQADDEPRFSAKQLADMLHLVMESDRTVYTRVIVNRLTLQDKVITASEHFEDDQALALPAQMFRFGAEMVSSKTEAFNYSLQSLWAVNKQNMPRTDVEKQGLTFLAENPGERYYGKEVLGGVKYLTAVYPDIAVAPACVSCHNDHADSPRHDFAIGDVMGGVVIRIPLE